jgi:hypothetical protein
MGCYFFGEEVMRFPRSFGVFSDALVSAPDARAYFLFDGKKKVAKEKATPGSESGYARSLALLVGPGGSHELACGSDNASRLPPARLRCSAPPKGPGKPSGAETGVVTISAGADLIFALFPASTATGKFEAVPSNRDAFRAPLRGAEQRRVVGGRRLALFEPQASLASRPTSRVAQGTGAAGTDPGVAFSLATFFLPSKRKYARASGAETCASEKHASQAIPQKSPHA